MKWKNSNELFGQPNSKGRKGEEYKHPLLAWQLSGFRNRERRRRGVWSDD